MTLETRLNEFITQMPLDQIADDIASETNAEASEVAAWLAIYLNESRASLRLIEPYLEKHLRILEVGAGLCILSLFLKSEGYNITAEEPALAGFDLFSSAKLLIMEHYQSLELAVIDRPASKLSLSVDGEFDLIYSNNVLEHVSDIEQSFTALCALTSRAGKMVHNCPNYVFPYEPHLHIPVIKPFKKLTELLFKKRVADKRALWESLNFITYFQVKGMGKNANVGIRFKKGLLYESFDRLSYDPLFKQRHGKSVVYTIYRILVATRLLTLLRYIPAPLVSPMQFEVNRRD